MKKTFFSLLIALCVLAMPVLAGADNVMPPDWAGEYGTTHLEWYTWNFGGTFFTPDVFTQNPAGPYVGMSYIAPGTWLPTPDGAFFLDPFSLLLGNFETPNPVKEIRLQITYQSMDNMPWILDVYGEPAVMWEPAFVDYVDHGEGWYTDVWDLSLWPNPWWEVIDVGDPYGGPLLVSQVVVDTWCVGSAVPVPAAIWLLGSGLIGLLGFRRKFKG